MLSVGKLAILVAVAIAVDALPVDPNDDVELIKPVNRNTGDSFPSGSGSDETPFSGRIPTILIIRRTHPFFGGIPFFRGAEPDYSEDDSVFGPKDSDESSSTDTDYDSLFPTAIRPTFLGPFFGIRKSDSNETSSEEDSSTDSMPCGFFCTIMRNFQAHVDQIEGEIAATRNNITSDSEDGDINNNSTYTEKVLPDGSVLKINRTVVSNTDKDSGTSFYFHSTLFHNGAQPGEESKEETDEKTGEKDIGDEAKSTTTTSSTSSTTTPTTTPAPADDDENEIVGEKKPEVGGVDDGLLQ